MSAAELEEELTPAFTPDLSAAAGLVAGPNTLVALDIDGTLLGHDGSLSTAVIDAVAALRDSGTHVVLATGRGTPSVIPIAQALGLTHGWAVCSNGAVTVRLDPALDGGYEFVDVVTFDPAPAVRLLLAEDPDLKVMQIHGRSIYRVIGLAWLKSSARGASFEAIAGQFRDIAKTELDAVAKMI